ncbi:MAG: TonB C-terminal domain-containing protein [Verrucomicrobiota bacterium]
MSANPPAKRKRKDANPLPWVLLAVALIVGAIWFVSRDSKSTRKTVKAEDTMIITLPPPPPPLPKVEPPPPKEEPPPEEEEEMIAQEPVPEDEPAPDDSPPEPPAGPDLGPGSAGGTGPSIGGGGGGNGNRIGGRRSASKYGWYAAKVQTSIREAMGRHPSTRSATISLQVRIWADSNGRITRAQLVGTSGNPAVDQSIRSQVLAGLQLPQAPPADMPMPINLRITGRKPTT